MCRSAAYLGKPIYIEEIVASPRQERVIDLLDAYAERFRSDFFASIPAPDKPTS